MQKAEGKFHFFQEGKDGFGINVDIPNDEIDSIEYSKNFLKSLI